MRLRGRQRGMQVVGLALEAHEPRRQPSPAALGEADLQTLVLVEQPGQEQVAEQALRAPHVGGGAGDGDVAPHVAVAGEVRRLVEERVVQHRQGGVLHRPPDRVEVGVVDRHSLGQHDGHGADAPLAGRRGDLPGRPLRVEARGEDRRPQPLGIGRAVVDDVAVVGGVELLAPGPGSSAVAAVEKVPGMMRSTSRPSRSMSRRRPAALRCDTPGSGGSTTLEPILPFSEGRCPARRPRPPASRPSPACTGTG